MVQRFTASLLEIDAHGFHAATQHPWLRLIGQGRLPSEAQLAWLQQDRLYAISYVPFIGSLLAKVSIPTQADRTSTLEWRISSMLIGALVNIKRELAMFEDILREHYGWGQGSDDAAVEPTTPTRTYQHLFAGAASPNSSMIIGLTALWGMEKCYLESWKYARSQQPVQAGKGSDDVVRQVLIPNWTSPEFEQFVNEIGGLLDELAARSEITQSEIVKCREIWRQILWCEEKFWPEVEETAA